MAALGSSFNQQADEDAWRRLHSQIAQGAEYSSCEDRSFSHCLPGTRVELLQTLETSLTGEDNKVVWLFGGSGSGKSSVAYTTAERLRSRDQLAATFFFSRKDTYRSGTDRVFFTLAYQIGLLHHIAKAAIIKAIRHDPDLLSPHKYHLDQFNKLLVEPLRELQFVWSTKRGMVFDAADEGMASHGNQIGDLVRMLVKLLRDPTIPICNILFTSRISSQLQALTRRPIIIDLVTLQHVESFNATEDIKLYLQYTFEEIYYARELEFVHSLPWPPADTLNVLVDQIKGQFIVAATVCRLVRDAPDPNDYLDVILSMYRGELRSLDLISGSIDSVYRYIVANPDVEDRQLGVEYLADIIALSSPLSLSDICNLFTTDVRKHIAHLSAIVSLPPMDSPSSVQIYHSSLRDYLSTRSRSGDFYVDPAESHRRLAGLCLKLMRRQLNPEIREQKAISGALRYACLYWPYHIEAMSHSAENQALVFQFIQEQLPFFLEAFSLMGCFDLAVVRLTEASRVVSSWKLSHEQNTFPAVFDVVTKYLQLIPVYPIYPAVALSHASFCLTDPSALSTLKDTLDEVIDRHKYDGPLSWLLCHAHIRAEFHKVIDTTLRIQPDNARCRHMFFETCPPADCDVASLAFQLSSIFKSYDNVIDFFSQEDQNAQTLVDVLQAVRIRSTIDARSQRMFRYGLIQLAANSGRYAQCLQLRNINIKWEMRPIGHGGLSAVYKGNIETQPDVQLALKVIRMSDESYSKRNLQKFASEVTVWSQLRHPNILSFSGVFQGEGRRELYTISPYLSYGNICNYLEINPSANRTLLALDVAQALNFLHGWSPEIVHANINGSNILVSDTGRACLVDFESTTAKDRPLDAVTMSAKACLVGEDDDMTSELSSIAWMAPEIFDEGTFGRMVFTTKSDMYAFGGVCYELFCGKTPFRGLRDAVIIFRILRGRTPDRIDGPHVDDSVWAFMQQCWRKEPTERPTAKEAVEFFKARVLDSGMSIEPAEEWDYSIMDENLKQAERFLYLDPHPTPCGSSSGQEVLT